MTAPTPSTTLPHDGRKYFYWTVESTSTGLGAVEIQVGETGTWLPTTATTPDAAGNPRYRILIAGPNADIGTATLQLSVVGRTWFRARIVDSPEVEVDRGFIDVI